VKTFDIPATADETVNPVNRELEIRPVRSHRQALNPTQPQKFSRDIHAPAPRTPLLIPFYVPDDFSFEIFDGSVLKSSYPLCILKH